MELTPAASLNRVRIVELLGVADTQDVLGRTAYELLAAGSLAGLVREQADALGLSHLRSADPTMLLPRFDRCFEDEDPAVRAAADAVARHAGRRLGCLILTLRRGDAANRAARPDWNDSYWAHWAAVTTVYLAGGVVSGHLGPRLVQHAARTLVKAGMADCRIRLTSRPADLPLVGAACLVSAGSQAAVVFDFGQSFVKRAHAIYDGDALSELRHISSLPARWTDTFGQSEPSSEQARRLADSMVSVIVETWRAVQASCRPLALTVAVSVASYVRDGQPLPRQGGPYAALAILSENLAGWLSDRLGRELGHPIEVVLIHDGTAAAYALAGEPNAAVITLGTALGVGFPPLARRLRPVAAEVAGAEPPEYFSDGPV